ncbi:MAG: hypothetical protein HYT86_05285, partial [candidate division NC10 bacterium]|nr:hypothetical protein [candidate division NC10 bacterium]
CHTGHGAGDALAVCRLAEAHRLLVTGGSDCHGEIKGEVVLGRVRLPWEHILRLYAAAGQPPPGPG